MPTRFYVETLGCPKNQVDSDKIVGTLLAEGMVAADDAAAADLVVVNTCAFIDAARQESIDTVLALSDARKHGARLVVTGCMAERYGDELAEAMPEVDLVAGFGVPVSLTLQGRPPPGAHASTCSTCPGPEVGGAVGLREDRRGLRPHVRVLRHPVVPGPAAQPHARGHPATRSTPSRWPRSCSSPRTWRPTARTSPGSAPAPSCRSCEAVSERVARTRLLYLYPSDLTDALIDAICATGVPYFDLSLQHVSKPLLRRMRRWGDGDRFLRRMADIRRREPDAAFRSNFIVGYPGETEADHDQLLAFVDAAQLDWCGFFAYSPEDGTYAAGLDGVVDDRWWPSAWPSCASCRTPSPRRVATQLIGADVEVLVDAPGVGRTHREAPEIDGIVQVPDDLAVGSFARVRVVDALGPDLVAVAAMTSSYSPDAITTWANAVTVARVLVVADPVRDDHRRRRLVAGAGAVDRAVRQRRHRRLAGPPPGRHPLGGLPRPAGRQGARARRHVHAGALRRVLDRARAHHHRPRGRHQRVPRRWPAATA